ncbi:MAG: peptidylprolyl isomerase [Clostridia bacterium]|nr:peptidylprolyl isomerase [Clostridia bacterium]MBR6742012.1 peptidylprolyl isomerase [Clostridia bacterium]
MVLITMDTGETIKIELLPEYAPKSAANFEKLVREGFYDGIIFHRVISGFMIQGGDPTGTGCGGSAETIPGEFIANGFNNTLEHRRGVVSMARTNDPNSASSQFFICHEDAMFLNGQYAAFGRVVEGMDTVDRIAAAKTDFSDRPLTDIVIKKAEII